MRLNQLLEQSPNIKPLALEVQSLFLHELDDVSVEIAKLGVNGKDEPIAHFYLTLDHIPGYRPLLDMTVEEFAGVNSKVSMGFSCRGPTSHDDNHVNVIYDGNWQFTVPHNRELVEWIDHRMNHDVYDHHVKPKLRAAVLADGTDGGLTHMPSMTAEKNRDFKPHPYAPVLSASSKQLSAKYARQGREVRCLAVYKAGMDKNVFGFSNAINKLNDDVLRKNDQIYVGSDTDANYFVYAVRP